MRRSTVAAIVLFAASCVDGLDYIEDAPCPCLDGYVCCPTTNTCRSLATCPDDLDPSLVVLGVDPAETETGKSPRVTITGEGFLPGTTFEIGGEPCQSVVVETSERATCVAPSGSPSVSTVSVTARLPNGESAVLINGFRFLLPRMVDVTIGSGLQRSGGFGPAVIDLDQDGRLDFLFPNQDADAPTLFRNDGALHYAAVPGPDWLPSYQVLAADLTGDGRDDAVLTGVLPRGLGLLRFDTGVVQSIGVGDATSGVPMGTSAVDIDGDGDLDLFGCYEDGDRPFFVAINDGLGDFIPAPELVPSRVEGVEMGGRFDCRDIAVADFDRDGDPDVVACGAYLALLENDGGAFVERTTARRLPSTILNPDLAPTVTGVEVPLNARGCTNVDWVDVDSDGDLDLAYQSRSLLAVEPGDAPHRRSGTVIYANGASADRSYFTLVDDLADDVGVLDCILVATDDFENASLHAGANAQLWFDQDHDGDLDLLLPMPSPICIRPPGLYVNRHAQGVAGFELVSLAETPVYGSAQAGALADLDGDGDLDAVLHGAGRDGGDHALLRNNVIENLGISSTAQTSYLRVRAVIDGRHALGATVELDLDADDEPDFALGTGKLAVRTIGRHGRGSGEAVAHFGLGVRDAPVWVRVRFGGDVEVVQRADTLNTTIVVEAP